MRTLKIITTAVSLIGTSIVLIGCQPAVNKNATNVELGPRPHFLVNDMDEGPLKESLKACENNEPKVTDFSIGHRGAAMQFPEHTKESYVAAAKMGAGILECDVTFTKDKELVCRHSQCDLHTTTNILAVPELAAKCSTPFSPADAAAGTPATARCCTSDITLAEFKTLKGKMDAYNPKATTVEEYMDATANWRTDLYASRGTLMTHAESIELFKSLNVKMTPELKAASVDMPYDGTFSQQAYAQKMINEYRIAGVEPKNVFPQSFNRDDVLYWIANEPGYGQQAVFLDDRVYNEAGYNEAVADMGQVAAQGIQYIAPPMYALVTLEDGKIVPSSYAEAAKSEGINMITWTLERSGFLKNGGGWYYQSVKDGINNDGDMYEMLDVLAQQVGIKGIFADWPATVTYYANCKGL